MDPFEQAMKIYIEQALAACELLPDGLKDAGRQLILNSKKASDQARSDWSAADAALALALARWQKGTVTLGSSQPGFQGSHLPLLDELHTAQKEFDAAWIRIHANKRDSYRLEGEAFLNARRQFFPADQHERLLRVWSDLDGQLSDLIETFRQEIEAADSECFTAAATANNEEELSSVFGRYYQSSREVHLHLAACWTRVTVTWESNRCAAVPDDRFFRALVKASRQRDSLLARAGELPPGSTSSSASN